MSCGPGCSVSAARIWSAPAGPVRQAAALAFSEPPALVERVALSRRLHASVARAVALSFAACGAPVPPPGSVYLYPDFSPLADVLLERHGITSDESWPECSCTSTASGCCRAARSARRAVRAAPCGDNLLLYERMPTRYRTLKSPIRARFPWIAASLARLEEVLADLTG